MELYTMRYILAIAEYRNFSLAAQACHIGQPALSHQVSRLEKELGVLLFLRNPHGVMLTEAGQAFVQKAREIVQQADGLEAAMAAYAGLRRGTLNLGIITSLQCIDFGGMLSAFSGSYPNISVNVEQDGTYGLLDRLNDRTLDAAFLNRTLSPMPATLEFLKLGEDVYSLAVPRLHRLAHRGQISLKELKNENFIFHQRGQVAYHLCLSACQRAGFEPRIVCRSANPTTGLYMVQGGLGVAFLPSEEFSSRSIDGVVELKIEEPIVKEVGIAWRKDNTSPLVDTVVRFAGEWRRF